MNEQFLACLAVTIGGGLGSLARYGVTLVSVRLWGEAFPWGTLGINVVGSFVIGIFFTLTLAEGMFPAGANTRLLVITGICGGFTTFSAFSLQTLQLIHEREYGPAFVYVAASVLLCLTAVALGYFLGETAGVSRAAAERIPLLAVAPRLETLDACLNAAEQVAPAFKASAIVALHVRNDPSRFVATSEELLTDHEAQRLRLEEQGRAEAMRREVEAWNASPQLPAKVSFLDLNTDLGAALYDHAANADLVILGKALGSSAVEDREALTVALFELRRPVLLVPANWRGSLGKTICIAWKPTPQAKEAVAAAEPLLKAASSVTILAGYRAAQADTTEVEGALAAMNITPKTEAFPIGAASVGRTLLDRAKNLGADLLVLGAYSHSRLREAVLGGVTRDVLAQADIPIFLVH
jgi:fluoride exporter